MSISKAEVRRKYFGTDDVWKAYDLDDLPLRGAQLYPIKQHCQTLPLPYQDPDYPDIPSLDEINTAIKENNLRNSPYLTPVCRIRDCVVKFRYDEGIFQEAENLLFLKKYARVRAPKLYAAFTHKTPGIRDTYYMISEYIPGKTLEDEWSVLSAQDRELICLRVAEQLQLLRMVPAPSPTYYGRIHHQPWSYNFPFCRTNWRDSCGPYDSYDALVEAMYTSLEYCTCLRDTAPEFYEPDIDILSRFRGVFRDAQDTRPVLSHFDVKDANIIVRRVHADKGKQDWEVTLIDWDTLGWAPPFLQGVGLWHRFFPEFFWNDEEEAERLTKIVLAHFDGSESWGPILRFLKEIYKETHWGDL